MENKSTEIEWGDNGGITSIVANTGVDKKFYYLNGSDQLSYVTEDGLVTLWLDSNGDYRDNKGEKIDY